jgi:hypothetical protein
VPQEGSDPTRLAALVDALSRGIVLTREKLAEALEDAVRRGRMTRADAEELTATLVGVGRQQAQDLLRAARLGPRKGDDDAPG